MASSSNAPNSQATLDTNDTQLQHQSTAAILHNARGGAHLSCLIHLNNQSLQQANHHHHHHHHHQPDICIISLPIHSEQSLDDRDDELGNNGTPERTTGGGTGGLFNNSDARRPCMRFVRQSYSSLRHINNYVFHHHHYHQYYTQALASRQVSPLFDLYVPQIAINRPFAAAAANTTIMVRQIAAAAAGARTIPLDSMMTTTTTNNHFILLHQNDDNSSNIIQQQQRPNSLSQFESSNSSSNGGAECPNATVDAAESPTNQVVMVGEETGSCGGGSGGGDHRRLFTAELRATQSRAISPTAAAAVNPRSAALSLHHNESESQTTVSQRTSARDTCLSCGQSDCLGSCSDEIFTFKEGPTDNVDSIDASLSEVQKTNNVYSDVLLSDRQKISKINSIADYDTLNDTKSINLGDSREELNNLYNKYDEKYEMYESLAKRSETLYFQFWYSDHVDDNKSYPESAFAEKPEELGKTISSASSRSSSLFLHNSNLYKSPWHYLLAGGSTYRGEQSPSGKCHDVSVTFKDCDLANDYCCGYLTIKGLTFDYPILTTFFEGEIIGNRYEFLTKKWQATYETDFKHWSKFKEFEQYKERFAQGTLDTGEIDRNDCLFMRWKEKFLVPCHQINSIPGASFAGFYYICLRRSKPSIFGFYYHQTSEWFQSLELEYIDTRTSGTYKFL